MNYGATCLGFLHFFVCCFTECMERECEQLRRTAADSTQSSVRPDRLNQAVKAVCTLLGHLQTLEIAQALDDLATTCQRISEEPVSQAVQQGQEAHRPPWRNWLARSAVNRKVGGSSPPGGGRIPFRSCASRARYKWRFGVSNVTSTPSKGRIPLVECALNLTMKSMGCAPSAVQR